MNTQTSRLRPRRCLPESHAPDSCACFACSQAVVSDIRLVFENALRYYEPASDMHTVVLSPFYFCSRPLVMLFCQRARELLSYFDQRMKQVRERSFCLVVTYTHQSYSLFS